MIEAERYNVIVGNIGKVHDTASLSDARFIARQYVDFIKGERSGRAESPVVVLRESDGEIMDEWEKA